MNLPKKTTVLIIVLAVVTALLVFLALSSRNSQLNLKNLGEPTVTVAPTVAPSTKIYFSPVTLDMASATSNLVSVDIMVDTSGKPVSTIQAELSYDPKLITNVTITPARTGIVGETNTPLFPNSSQVLIKSVDIAQGRISYAMGISLSDAEVSGVGKIATLTFNVAPSTVQATTEMTFLPKSVATTLSTQESILKETVPLTIKLSKTFAPTAVPFTSSTPTQ